ncbi:MAG: tRNA (N6-isopentenyl adenosine(37)-C2)-methylthiotransferase MiaB [Planctomycetes bacterium]|nr:tRNA (N6-isopentenyl adenosine(37)-C2)-methylthiotransferase MiaB [Planctomycetota bacterium]
MDLTDLRKYVYIETMGCQMNKLDSELIGGDLLGRGYRLVDDGEAAGVIIDNTCSVRQHAEDKVISKLGQLAKRHREQKDLVIVVVGCMAQRMGQELLDNYRQVDVVCGPGQLHRLGEMIEQAQQDQQRQFILNDPAEIEGLEQLDMSHEAHLPGSSFMAFLRVMRGCNKFCSYCVVPYVRGPEHSRPIEHIVVEARRLVDNGIKEITLLGQTVNSYKYQDGGRSYGLADVLEKLHEIEGLERLRFVTSYPRDFDEKILQAMADMPRVCEYLHIPAQSGSDRILKTMNRRYTASEYLELIERAREMVPGIAFSGDFIVGFTDEDEQDFEATKELMRKVRYKNCFIFKYSVRPGTRAEKKLEDNISEEIKRRRNTELLEVQNEISLVDNQRFVGETVEILVAGLSKNPHLNQSESDTGDQNTQLVGRTGGDHIVVFNGTMDLIGKIIPVNIEKVSSLTLFANYQA